MLRDEEVARIKIALSERLRERREALGISKNALAQAAGIAVQTVSFIESGTNSPSVSTLLRLCVVLKVDPGKILDEARKA